MNFNIHIFIAASIAAVSFYGLNMTQAGRPCDKAIGQIESSESNGNVTPTTRSSTPFSSEYDDSRQSASADVTHFTSV